MPEKDTIYSSEVKYAGIFSFKDFYNFCFEWLKNQTGLDVVENKYNEKFKGDTKEIEIKWSGSKELSDYFKFEASIEFKVEELKEVEIVKDGIKQKTNQGKVSTKVTGVLIKDHKGKFEITAFKKFMRAIYEKWVITSRISEMEDKVAGACDTFISQVKAYLDLEGK